MCVLWPLNALAEKTGSALIDGEEPKEEEVMFVLVVAACAFGSEAVAAVPFGRLGLDEQWLLDPDSLSVPDFRLRALRPATADGRRPLVFSCSAATALGDVVENISWDVSSLRCSGVVSVDSRTGFFGALAVVDSLLAIAAPTRARNASVACAISLPRGPRVVLKSALAHPQLEVHAEMKRECNQQQCQTIGAVCRLSSQIRTSLCSCPDVRAAYDRFYDVCYKGRTLHEHCLFSETCSSADTNSRCVNGTCQCPEGLHSLGLGPCQRWGSYGEPCDATAGCAGPGLVCGPEAMCDCDQGRVRVNDSCLVGPEEEEDDAALSAGQRMTVVSSVVITVAGILLALTMCGSLRQRPAEGSEENDVISVASYKFPESTNARSEYMSTQYLVPGQPCLPVAHRGSGPKMYLGW
ncbi:uncharacterized protein LOC144136507 [Amblyomma americanum]